MLRGVSRAGGSRGDLMSDARADLHELCDLLEALLVGAGRRELVGALTDGADGPRALERLRAALREQRLGGAGTARALEGLSRRLDQRTRREGFRVLHSWDHRLHRFSDEPTPVLMLDFFRRAAGPEPKARTATAILLDYHYLHLLALCAMRAWDSDDPGAILARVTGLLGSLQGEDGSGHAFVADAETLIIYALSQFHPEELAYERLIEKVAGLDEERRIRFAGVSAAVLGCHLRWGFWLMYGRDVLRMRSDNVGDYPWLLTSVLTLMRAYATQESPAEGPGRDAVLDGLVQGLAADPWAFTGKVPRPLAGHVAEHAELRALLERHGADLLVDLEGSRPAKATYSPLSLHFNFPHNALVALVAMALLRGEPLGRPLNALLARERQGASPPALELARALTAYAGSSPARLGARGAMLVAYDPLSGLRSFTMTTDALREIVPEATAG